MAQKKCAVVTYENRDLPFKEEFRKNQKEYCLKHSYDYLCYDTYALSIPPYWLKPFIVRNIRNRYCDTSLQYFVFNQGHRLAFRNYFPAPFNTYNDIKALG